MLPYQVNYYGNPHSRTHAFGWESERAMELAREVHTRADSHLAFIYMHCLFSHDIYTVYRPNSFTFYTENLSHKQLRYTRKRTH